MNETGNRVARNLNRNPTTSSGWRFFITTGRNVTERVPAKTLLAVVTPTWRTTEDAAVASKRKYWIGRRLTKEAGIVLAITFRTDSLVNLCSNGRENRFSCCRKTRVGIVVLHGSFAKAVGLRKNKSLP
jgi:hypothetical protein